MTDSEQDTSGGQRRCTYCFQELNEMTDPRLLPCTHIVCLPCLKNDWKLEEPQCRACNKSFGDFDALPKIDLHIHIQPQAVCEVATSFRCDICDDHSNAVNFCVDCGKKMCNEHMKSHQHFFKNSHKTVTINAYADRPDYYSPTSCENHPNNIVDYMCDKWFSLSCRHCPPGVCESGGTHRYQLLEAIRPTIQAEFDDLMKKCSEKIAELCNLEKQTWRMVDDLNEKCEAMISQVDETTKQQIEEIIKRSDELKQQIVDSQGEVLINVGTYTAELIAEVDKIEQVQMDMQQFLQRSPTSKIVKGRVAELHKLERINTLKKAPFKLELWHQPQLVSTGIHREIELRLVTSSVTLPRSLIHVKDYKIPLGSICRALKLMDNNKLLVGCSSYLGEYNLVAKKVTRSLHNSHNILSVDLNAEMSEIYFSQTSSVWSAAPNLDTKSKLIPDTDVYGTLCVSGKYILRCSNNDNRIMIFNTEIKEKQDYSLAEHAGGQIHSICSAPDDSILTLDGNKGIVCCYKLQENATPILRWKCAGITGGYAICTDDQGLVYVSTHKKLYVILKGTLKNILECPQIPHHGPTSASGDISVYGNRLVTTQDQSVTIKMFRLE